MFSQYVIETLASSPIWNSLDLPEKAEETRSIVRSLIAAEVNFMRYPISKRLMQSLPVVKLKIPCKPFYSVPDALI
jgi:hypothetical protein